MKVVFCAVIDKVLEGEKQNYYCFNLQYSSVVVSMFVSECANNLV